MLPGNGGGIGLLTPATGGRHRAARVQTAAPGRLVILRASAPLRGGVWYADTLEYLLNDDAVAEARAQRLNESGQDWRFKPARERRTFEASCADPLTGLILRFHQPATPPPPHHSPELYTPDRQRKLRRLIPQAPAAWCLQCRQWINQDTGEEF